MSFWQIKESLLKDVIWNFKQHPQLSWPVAELRIECVDVGGWEEVVIDIVAGPLRLRWNPRLIRAAGDVDHAELVRDIIVVPDVDAEGLNNWMNKWVKERIN